MRRLRPAALPAKRRAARPRALVEGFLQAAVAMEKRIVRFVYVRNPVVKASDGNSGGNYPGKRRLFFN